LRTGATDTGLVRLVRTEPELVVRQRVAVAGNPGWHGNAGWHGKWCAFIA